jgi:uncharacterized protein (TIGR02271 family)
MQFDETQSDRFVIPVHEETIDAAVHPIDKGMIRLRKRVETVPYETTVEAGRDEVTVERVKVDRQVDAVPEPRQEGETLVIPVVEEVIVTETRLMLREEVRITRRRVTESVPVRDTIRREVVEIEQLPPAEATGS